MSRSSSPRPGALAASILATSSLFVAGGCRASFDVAPQDASKIFPGNTVSDVYGDPREVPSGIEAHVRLERRGDTRAMYPEEGGEAAIAEVVDDDQVRAARDRGLTDRDVPLAMPVEGGVAPLGQGVPLSRGDAPVATQAPPGLWVRRDDGRLLEIPLDYVDTIHVRETRMHSGAIVAIVGGSVAGAVLLVVGTVAFFNAGSRLD